MRHLRSASSYQMKIKDKILRFLSEEHAATAVEYAVMLMLIAAACIVAIQSVGSEMVQVWDDNVTKMDAAINN